MIEIKHINGHVLYTAESASDVREALVAAVRERAYLQGAYLRGAYLQGADLRGAYLQGAYLQGAYLQGAYLQGARGVSRERLTPLLLLADQPGRIVAYKLVTATGDSPIHGKTLRYEIGKTLTEPDADTNPDEQCSAGINLATLDWCLAEWRTGYRVFRCSFTKKDIAAIPTATDGKFRVKRCKVESEVDLEAIFATEREDPPNGSGPQ